MTYICDDLVHEPHPHPFPPLDTLHSRFALVTLGTRREGEITSPPSRGRRRRGWVIMSPEKLNPFSVLRAVCFSLSSVFCALYSVLYPAPNSQLPAPNYFPFSASRTFLISTEGENGFRMTSSPS